MPNPEIWSEIRTAAVAVTVLTVRPSGLWDLPVRGGAHNYAENNSREAKQRDAESFGHPSITATYFAIQALRLAAGNGANPFIQQADAEILRSRKSVGSFGSRSPDRNNQIRIVGVPRHTAMAALFIMDHSLFGDRAKRAGLLKQTPT